VALAGCNAGGQLDRLAAGERGHVAEVRNGETIVLDSGLVVRLAGIEAPNEPEPWAEEARAILSGLLAGKAVTLMYGGVRRDRYDRALAHVRRDEGRLWVQDALLKAGSARVHTWPDNRALAKAMLRTEAETRIARRGLWALPAYQVLLPSEAVSRRGFAIIEGRISRVADEGRGLRVSFAEGGADLFAVGHSLDQTRIQAGRIIRARGWLTAGTIRIDHPEALEQLAGG
jgi:micrococcal nuclease